MYIHFRAESVETGKVGQLEWLLQNGPRRAGTKTRAAAQAAESGKLDKWGKLEWLLQTGPGRPGMPPGGWPAGQK